MFVVRCGDFLSCAEGESSSFVGLHASVHKTTGLWGGAEWIIRTHNKHRVSSICSEVGGIFSFFFFFSFSQLSFSLIDDRLAGYATRNVQILKDDGNYFINNLSTAVILSRLT